MRLDVRAKELESVLAPMDSGALVLVYPSPQVSKIEEQSEVWFEKVQKLFVNKYVFAYVATFLRFRHRLVRIIPSLSRSLPLSASHTHTGLIADRDSLSGSSFSNVLVACGKL